MRSVNQDHPWVLTIWKSRFANISWKAYAPVGVTLQCLQTKTLFRILPNFWLWLVRVRYYSDWLKLAEWSEVVKYNSYTFYDLKILIASFKSNKCTYEPIVFCTLDGCSMAWWDRREERLTKGWWRGLKFHKFMLSRPSPDHRLASALELHATATFLFNPLQYSFPSNQ